MDKVIVIRHSDNVNEKSNMYQYQKYTEKYGLHFSKSLQEYASKEMENTDGTKHVWTSDQITNVLKTFGLTFPNTSTIEDVTYTANMAYADFYPDILDEHNCIKYAIAVASDKDGYEGIQFCRWIADTKHKGEYINFEEFI